ncbi:glycosyltransferase [Acetobacter persici]|uniref:glycosyltransferase n=1 Tax=Acetobacter persici TaxID=1076596 RepID=UPI001BACED10|nr:glycosyltransferase [Acetobacter persici]
MKGARASGPKPDTAPKPQLKPEPEAPRQKKRDVASEVRKPRARKTAVKLAASPRVGPALARLRARQRAASARRTRAKQPEQKAAPERISQAKPRSRKPDGRTAPVSPAVLQKARAPKTESAKPSGGTLAQTTSVTPPQAIKAEQPSGPRFPPLRGHLDVRERGRLAGWASDGSGRPVRLRVLDNGITLGTVLAQTFRADLKKAGFGEGQCAFEFIIEGGLSDTEDHAIRVERVEDHAALVGSPWIVRAKRQPVAPARAVAPLPLPSAECGQGYLDYVDHRRVCGWAQDAARPHLPVTIQILDNGVLVTRVLANRYRGDLDVAGSGGGRHGFDCLLPVPFTPTERHVIRVLRDEDGVELRGSPWVLDPVAELGADVQDAFARIVQNLHGRKNSEQALGFLMEQVTALRQKIADQATGRPRKAQERDHAVRSGTRAAGKAKAQAAGRILFVDDYFPDPTRDAGSQAIFSHMQAAQALGLEVVFAASREQVAPPAARALLERAKISVWSLPFCASVEEGLRLEQHGFACVYLHRVGIVSRYMDLVRLYQPKARVIYSVADLHFLRLERQAREMEQPELLPRAARVRLLEGLGALQANVTLTHSPVEAALLHQLAPGARVCIVPWCVQAVRKKPRLAGRRGVVFVGHYAHVPNVDAAFWLVREVMPLVWAYAPDMPCVLVGSSMPPSVQALAGPQVQALGHVPDLAPLYAQMRVAVAPLRFGAGVKGKVLDSFAAGLPCVMTPVAAEGLALPEILQPLVARDAAGFARVILALQDDARATAVAQAGWQFVKEHFSRKTITGSLKTVFL